MEFLRQATYESAVQSVVVGKEYPFCASNAEMDYYRVMTVPVSHKDTISVIKKGDGKTYFIPAMAIIKMVYEDYKKSVN